MSVIDLALSRALMLELSQEPDGEQALRKALLGLILLVQDELSEDLTSLIDYLLVAFPPLSQAFEHQHHPFIGDEPITRLHLVDHVEVAVREDFVRQLVGNLQDDGES